MTTTKSKFFGIFMILLLTAAILTPGLAAAKVGPYEVKFHTQADLKGKTFTVSLKRGDRHKLLPNISAVTYEKGDKVYVSIFPLSNFGWNIVPRQYYQRRKAPGRRVSSMHIRSAVITPRGQGCAPGVLFRGNLVRTIRQSSLKLYPLPENSKKTSLCYSNLGWDKHTKIHTVQTAGRNVRVRLFKGTGCKGRLVYQFPNKSSAGSLYKGRTLTKIASWRNQGINSLLITGDASSNKCLSTAAAQVHGIWQSSRSDQQGNKIRYQVVQQGHTISWKKIGGTSYKASNKADVNNYDLERKSKTIGRIVNLRVVHHGSGSLFDALYLALKIKFNDGETWTKVLQARSPYKQKKPHGQRNPWRR